MPLPSKSAMWTLAFGYLYTLFEGQLLSPWRLEADSESSEGRPQGLWSGQLLGGFHLLFRVSTLLWRDLGDSLDCLWSPWPLAVVSAVAW